MDSGIRRSDGNFDKTWRTAANISINLISPKARAEMLNIFAADTIGLPYILHSCFPRKNSRCIWAKAEFNVKWLFMVIQHHAFWDPWKGDEGLNNITCGVISRFRRYIARIESTENRCFRLLFDCRLTAPH